MHALTVIVIALGLALDAFAVSVASGIAVKRDRVRNAFKIALFFGGFQAVMPVIGWLAGLGLREFITGVDHWVAFGLLVFIGGKMIYESTRLERIGEETAPTEMPALLMLSLATSIDALAVGLSFSFLRVAIAIPVIVIGLVTFLVCFGGFLVGTRVGHLFEKRVEMLGGLILVAIGIKILIEHLLR